MPTFPICMHLQNSLKLICNSTIACIGKKFKHGASAGYKTAWKYPVYIHLITIERRDIAEIDRIVLQEFKSNAECHWRYFRQGFEWIFHQLLRRLQHRLLMQLFFNGSKINCACKLKKKVVTLHKFAEQKIGFACRTYFFAHKQFVNFSTMQITEPHYKHTPA